MFLRSRFSVLVLCAFCVPASLTAATLNVPETFGDGGTPAANGWTVGNSGAVTADTGENGVGDHAVEYGTTAGFHFLHPVGGSPPNPVFLGDYLAAGVTAIQFKARHSGVGDTVSLRATSFLPFSGGVDWAISASPLILTPNNTSWQTYELSLIPSDLVSGGDNGVTTTDVLANVAQIGLRHDPAGTGPMSPSFVSTLTTVYFDDVVLVPEPSSLAMMLFAGLVALRFGRRK